MFLRVVGGYRVPGVHKQFGIVDVQGWRGVPGSSEEHLEVLGPVLTLRVLGLWNRESVEVSQCAKPKLLQY